MKDEKKGRTRNPGFRRMERLFGEYLARLEKYSGDKDMFYRRLIMKGRDGCPEEIVTDGPDAEEMRLWAAVLQETEKLRRTLYGLPGWEAREKIGVEKAKLDLMARKLEGGGASACGIVEIPRVLEEDPEGIAVEG